MGRQSTLTGLRTPYLIILVLLCVLVPLTLAASEDSGSGQPPATPIPTIAKRVETLRGLRYKTIPKPVNVTPETAQKEGLEVLDRDYPVAQRRADEALYELLGLLPPGSDLREINGSIFGEQVAGYYDPADGRLRIVTGAATGNQVLSEVTIAHELDHALEDQAIGLDLDEANASDDAGYAYRALVEGSATALMFTYLERYFDRDVALGGLLGGSLNAGSTAGIPGFILAGLIFPYQEGQKFVTALYERGGNTWTLVDLAERDRPPVSTEQVLHPEKWIDVEEPERVTLPPAPAGYETLTAGTFGEWQTGQWLRDRDAAAGWGGDRYALYADGARKELVMRFVWDTPQDLREFTDALPDDVTPEVDDGAVTVRLTMSTSG
jgi:hypothetical protein